MSDSTRIEREYFDSKAKRLKLLRETDETTGVTTKEITYDKDGNIVSEFYFHPQVKINNIE